MKTLKKSILTFIIALCITIFLSSSLLAKDVYSTYYVQKGDTVSTLAAKYKVTQQNIIVANNVNNYMLYANTTIVIDSTANNHKTPNYTVKKNDTLWKIAKKCNTTVSKIIAVNDISDRIYPNQKILVPLTGNTITTNASVQQLSITASNSNNSSKLSISEADLYKIAKMIYAEARGESYQGQVAVGAVIINRINSNLFPNTVDGVLFQKHQFTAYSDGQYYLTPNQTAINAAREAVNGNDPTKGALFYWNPVKAPNNAFLNAKPILVQIGSHVYAK